MKKVNNLEGRGAACHTLVSLVALIHCRKDFGTYHPPQSRIQIDTLVGNIATAHNGYKTTGGGNKKLTIGKYSVRHIISRRNFTFIK